MERADAEIVGEATTIEIMANRAGTLMVTMGVGDRFGDIEPTAILRS